MRKVYSSQQSISFDSLIDTYLTRGVTNNLDVDFLSFLEKKITNVNHKQQQPTCSETLIYKPGYKKYRKIVNEQQFISICEDYQISANYFNTLIQTFDHLSEEEKSILFTSQIIQISSERSYYHFIQKIIKARQKCIAIIRHELIENNKQVIVKVSELDRICLLMVHLRILTLLLVERISEWTIHLESLGTQSNNGKLLKFQDNFGSDVLQKISKDTHFLKNTKLRKFLKFSKGFDPLLIRMNKRMKKQSTMLIVNYDEDMIEDRFNQVVHPEVEFIVRLKEAENLLIKYHTKKRKQSSCISQQQSIDSRSDKLSQYKSIQIPRLAITPIQIYQQRISLPRSNYFKQERNIKTPGFISRRSSVVNDKFILNTPNHSVNEILNQSSQEQRQQSQQDQQYRQYKKQHVYNPEQPKNDQGKLIQKIKQLKSQLKIDTQKQTIRFVQKFKRHSEPTIRAQKKNVLSIIHSQRQEKPSHSTQRLRRRKFQSHKIKVLKNIYKEKIEEDLEKSLKIMKNKISNIINQRRKINKFGFYNKSVDDQNFNQETIKKKRKMFFGK